MNDWWISATITTVVAAVAGVIGGIVTAEISIWLDERKKKGDK